MVATQCMFEDNEAYYQAAGLYISQYSHVQIDSCSFANHSGSRYDGGAMFFIDSHGTLDNVIAEKNSALKNAGGIYFLTTNVEMTRCSFYKNTATVYGGGVYVFCSITDIITVTIDSCNISSNVGGKGGGVYVFGGGDDTIIQLSHSFIVNNTAVYGGGMFVLSGIVKDLGSTISDNHAASGEFELVSNSGACTVDEGCFYTRNFPNDYNGGDVCIFRALSQGVLEVKSFFIGYDHLFVPLDSSVPYRGDFGPDGVEIRAGEELLFRTVVSDPQEGFEICYAGAIGGGVYIVDGEVTFENSLINSNDALKYGGGIYIVGGVNHLINVAMFDNHASTEGQEIYFTGGALSASKLSVSRKADNTSLGGASSSAAVCSSACLPGEYGRCDTLGSSVCPVNCECFNCTEGTYSDVEGSTSLSDCESCAAGRYSQSGASSCQTCASGSYASDNSSDTGGGLDYQVFSGATSCNPCPAGYFSSSAATLVCQACDAGKYSTSGASTCSTCGPGTYSGNGDSQCTPCEAGKFSESDGATTCSSCEALKTSPIGATSCSEAVRHYYIVEESSTSRACPNHAFCYGGYYVPIPTRNYWSDRSTINYVDQMYHCYRDTCKGGENHSCWLSTAFFPNVSLHHKCVNHNLLCRKGSEGPLCGSCMDNYWYYAVEKQCQECTSQDLFQMLMPIMVILMSIITYLMWKKSSQYVVDVSTSFVHQALNYLFKSGSLKVLFSTYQIIQSITFSMDIVYPKPFSSFLQLSRIFAFEIPGLECAGFGVYSKVYLMSGIPIAIAFLSIMIGYLRLCACSSFTSISCNTIILEKAQTNQVLSQHSWFLLILSYLVLPPVTGVQFRALDCFSLSLTDHSRVLRLDTSINCDSDHHQLFQVIDGALIAVYLSVPFIWFMLLWKHRNDLFPFGILDDDIIKQRRKLSPSLRFLSFLYKSYRIQMAYFEIPEMFRRILFIGVIPLLASSTLKRSMIGLGFSLVSMILFRELMPYAYESTNLLAFIAQVVILLTYGGSLLIEVDFTGSDSFSFALTLLAINLTIVCIAFFTAFVKVQREEKLKQQKKEKLVKTVEWACHFSENKFLTTFSVIKDTVIPSSHALVFCYGRLVTIKQMLRSGIISSTSSTSSFLPKCSGIVFTLNLPSKLTATEKSVFQSTEAFVVCSLPLRLLQPITMRDASPRGGDTDTSKLWLLPENILSAMRGTYFGDLIDSQPWVAGECELLSPVCILRAYQIQENTEGWEMDISQHEPSTRFGLSSLPSLPLLKALSSKSFNEQQKRSTISKHETYDAMENERGLELSHVNPMPSANEDRNPALNPTPSFIHRRDTLLANINTAFADFHKESADTLSLDVRDVEAYVNTMSNVRKLCSRFQLLPLYHYTQVEVAPLILQSGFRMSTQGQGDGGVYFSTQGPASYGLGSESYEQNLIIDCFGKERLSEYLGKHKLDVCLVYAVSPLIIEQAPGGRDNAVVVPKRYFEAFSLPHYDGNYFLNPCRLLAAFHLTTSPPTRRRSDTLTFGVSSLMSTNHRLSSTQLKQQQVRGNGKWNDGLAYECRQDIEVQKLIQKIQEEKRVIAAQLKAELALCRTLSYELDDAHRTMDTGAVVFGPGDSEITCI